MAERVRITDVAPRDGLQNEPWIIAAADKARLVERLAASGVDEVEVTSFVSPRWVPQLGDAADVLALMAGGGERAEAGRRPVFSALVPNEQGMRAALAANERAGHPLLTKVAVFTAASETFSQKNTNATIAESIERFKPVVALAREHGLAVRGYVSCAIACPFEGPIPPRKVAQVAGLLLDLGCDEVDLGDTIGAAEADSITLLLNDMLDLMGEAGVRGRLTLHLHDTFGRAVECVREALHLGVRSFDGAAGGLGGCPYASTPGRRAPGNIDTRALVGAIHDEGYQTGVDLARLEEAAAFARSLVGRDLEARA